METSMNYNRMTTIFFYFGYYCYGKFIYCFTPYLGIRKDFGISNAVASLNGVIFSLRIH